MNDYNFNSGDGVPVKVQRIFDSCSDKDCLCDLSVTLSAGQLPDNINILRSRSAAVDSVCVSVEPVPFNRGFYQIDITLTFTVELLGYERNCTSPEIFTGTCYASKSCILYGSEASARTFTSEQDDSSEQPPENNGGVNLPIASVSVLEPIVLETKICCSCCGDKNTQNARGVLVTLGLFSVVELSRPMNIMVPAMEYSIPRKECCADSESPCEIFDRLKFPEEEFTPVSIDGVIREEEEPGFQGNS